jgi:hypothetical protein
MNKLLFAMAGATVFAIVSANAPVSAMPAQPTLAGTVNNIDQIQWRRHHRCWTERVVRRNRHGRRVMIHRRVCR